LPLDHNAFSGVAVALWLVAGACGLQALGDGTVLYKYLNPNMQAIATLTPYDKRTATMSLYLIDVVKGRIMDKTVQEGVRGPVHLAQSENWLVCHYRNRKMKRHEVAVMQLYEADAKVRRFGHDAQAGILAVLPKTACRPTP